MIVNKSSGEKVNPTNEPKNFNLFWFLLHKPPRSSGSELNSIKKNFILITDSLFRGKFYSKFSDYNKNYRILLLFKLRKLDLFLLEKKGRKFT